MPLVQKIGQANNNVGKVKAMSPGLEQEKAFLKADRGLVKELRGIEPADAGGKAYKVLAIEYFEHEIRKREEKLQKK